MFTTKEMVAVIIFAFAAVSGQTDAKTIKVTLYEHQFFRGNDLKVELEDSMCYNLPDEWINEVSSFQMDRGPQNCVVFYRGKDCNYMDGLQGFNGGQRQSLARKNLEIVGFNEVAQSLRKCGH